MEKIKRIFNKNFFTSRIFKTVILFCIGFAALIWFLVRVIPKPSRAAYPCQQAAFPFASAFVLWISGILSSSLIYVKAKAKWRSSKYILAFVLFLLAISIFLMTSTSLKHTPVMARAYVFTNSLLGNSLPVLQSYYTQDICVVEPVAFVGTVKSSVAYAEEIDSSEIATMASLAIERAGGLEGIVSDGDMVILKPNLVVSSDGTAAGQQLNPEVNGITTDYRLMQAVVNIINEINPTGVIYIVEGSASGSTATNMSILDYDQITGIDSLICLEDVCGDWGDTTSIYLQCISLPPDKVLYNGANNRYYLYELYHDADVVISMPVLKNHVYTGTTGGVKNVGIGATPPTIYANYPDILRWKIDHEDPPRTNLHYWIHDFYMCRPVDFVIMDGLQSIQNGPVSIASTPDISYDQMNMRLILACKDALAVDAIGALLTGHDPGLIPHLVTLHNDSLGCSDARLIRVNGIKVGDEKKDFEITDTGELSKYFDFEQPVFSINECYVIDNKLHFSLTVDEDITKVEVTIDSLYLNQITICDFDHFSLDLDTLEVNSETEIIVYGYDQYLNYSTEDASGMVSAADHALINERTEVYPNPCSNSTHLRIVLTQKRLTICDLYQVSGLKIRQLLNEVKMPGEYEIKLDVSEIPAGVYLIRLQAGKQIVVKKLIVK